MAETKFSNGISTGYKGKRVPKSSPGGIGFLRMLRSPFLLFLILSLVMVYIYYLYSIGQLQKTILDIWTKHQKVIVSLSIFITYSAINFQLGVRKGEGGSGYGDDSCVSFGRRYVKEHKDPGIV